MSADKIVIIGGGIAGLTCAAEIRKNSEDADIILITEDTRLPYYRINLTRLLAGETDEAGMTIHPESWYAEKRIQLLLGREVAEIRRENREILLKDGLVLSYDRLVLATGANPFIPPIPGTELGNVATVRTIEDVHFVLAGLKDVKECICIGGGILGLEVAGAIARTGVKITLLEAMEWLMPLQLNRKAAAHLKKYLLSIGIEVREGIKIEEIQGEGTCDSIRLSTGEVLHARLIVFTAGVRPVIGLAREAGIETKRGIIVDDHMRTSDENIFAAGDVTEHHGVVHGLWSVAQLQGKIVGQAALGMDIEFHESPSSTVLKVLGIDIMSIGEFEPRDAQTKLYEIESEERYICFAIREGMLVGSIIVGDKLLPRKVKPAVEKGMLVPEESLRDGESILAWITK